EIVELLDDVAPPRLLLLGGQPPRLAENLDVRPQGCDRSAQLVARVGDQVALGLDRALERVQRRVEALREACELVVALYLQAPRQIEAAGEGLGLARETRDGRESRPCDDHPDEC